MPLLSVEDLHTYYGEAHILQGVSLRLDEGEVVTLIGRNGAGKTTTLRSIMGIARPSRGRVTLRGDDLTRRPPHEISRRGIAWVPEERRILPNLTVLDNLRLGLRGAGHPDGATAFEAPEKLGPITPRMAGSCCSAVAAAGALAGSPTSSCLTRVTLKPYVLFLLASSTAS